MTGIGVAVVGTGFGRRVVAPAFAAVDGCTVVGVVSARDESAVADVVARPDVGLVSIHSPPFMHATHVRMALDAGKAVLCDKPFAMSAAEAQTLEHEADAAGVVNFVNFEFRYHPARRLVRDLVRDGTVGTVEHISWVHLSSGTRVPLRPYGWLFDRGRGGGWIGAWASHAIDTLRFCFDEVADAVGFPRTAIRERPGPDGVMHECSAEDGLAAVLTLRGGATVAIDSSYAAAASTTPRLTVVGQEATLEVVADERVVLRGPEGSHRDFSPPIEAGPDRHDAPMRAWARVVVESLREGEAPDETPTFADGRACDEVLERLRRA